MDFVNRLYLKLPIMLWNLDAALSDFLSMSSTVSRFTSDKISCLEESSSKEIKYFMISIFSC